MKVVFKLKFLIFLLKNSDKLTEEIVELLEPGNPNLKNPMQCAYREGRKYRDEGLTPKKYSEIALTGKSNLVICNPTIHSFERFWYFTLGIMGKTCNVMSRKSKDYCKEECKLVCEYGGSVL